MTKTTEKKIETEVEVVIQVVKGGVGVVGVDTVEVGVGIDVPMRKVKDVVEKNLPHGMRNVPRKVVGVKKDQVGVGIDGDVF